MFRRYLRGEYPELFTHRRVTEAICWSEWCGPIPPPDKTSVLESAVERASHVGEETKAA